LQQINEIDKTLLFKLSTESNDKINFLDLLIQRNNRKIVIAIFRKPTEKGTVIHCSSNHPLEHKHAAFYYYINRMLTLPITKQYKQKEWETITSIARNNGYPITKIQNLKTRLKMKQKEPQQQNRQNETTNAKKKWTVFTYFSPLVRKITNLFKQTQLRIAFRATNTIQQQLTEKQIYADPSGIYKLKCNTCNRVYVGQSGSAIKIRYKEHIRYIRSKNATSAYATHILENKHEYGKEEHTLELLKRCQKGKHMDGWEALYIQTLHHQGILIEEQ
jgi:hypothetical protein